MYCWDYTTKSNVSLRDTASWRLKEAPLDLSCKKTDKEKREPELWKFPSCTCNKNCNGIIPGCATSLLALPQFDSCTTASSKPLDLSQRSCFPPSTSMWKKIVASPLDTSHLFQISTDFLTAPLDFSDKSATDRELLLVPIRLPTEIPAVSYTQSGEKDTLVVSNKLPVDMLTITEELSNSHLRRGQYPEKKANHQTLRTKTQSVGVKKIHSCEACGKSYKQVRDYRAHLATHTNAKVYRCDICLSNLENPSAYVHHLQEHRQKGLHRCQFCERYFRDKCTLATHLRIHTGEKPYHCQFCEKRFRQIGTYRRHQKIHG